MTTTIPRTLARTMPPKPPPWGTRILDISISPSLSNHCTTSSGLLSCTPANRVKHFTACIEHPLHSLFMTQSDLPRRNPKDVHSKGRVWKRRKGPGPPLCSLSINTFFCISALSCGGSEVQNVPYLMPAHCHCCT